MCSISVERHQITSCTVNNINKNSQPKMEPETFLSCCRRIDLNECNCCLVFSAPRIYRVSCRLRNFGKQFFYANRNISIYHRTRSFKFTDLSWLFVLKCIKRVIFRRFFFCWYNSKFNWESINHHRITERRPTTTGARTPTHSAETNAEHEIN